MSRRALLVLGAVALGLLLTLTALRLGDEAPPGVGDPLLPGLGAELAEISTVRIITAGELVVATLELRNDRWVVAERDDWPADTARLRALLLALVEARRLEERSANPALHPRLGVAPMDHPEASGTGIVIETPTETFALIIGESGVGGGDDSHVRREDEASAWLVSGRLEVARRTGDWLVRELLDLPANEVLSVTIEHPDGELLRLVRSGEGENRLKVQGLPDGRRLLHDTVAEASAAALAGLRLEDVAAVDSVFGEDLPAVRTLLETREGTTISLQLVADADGGWLRIDGGFEEDPRLAGRAFRISRARTQQLTRRMEDLLLPE